MVKKFFKNNTAFKKINIFMLFINTHIYKVFINKTLEIMEPTNCAFQNWCWSKSPAFMAFIIIAVIVDLVLKGIALWRAAKNQHIGWFLALFIINSIGILPLIYLITVDKKEK